MEIVGDNIGRVVAIKQNEMKDYPYSFPVIVQIPVDDKSTVVPFAALELKFACWLCDNKPEMECPRCPKNDGKEVTVENQQTRDSGFYRQQGEKASEF